MRSSYNGCEIKGCKGCLLCFCERDLLFRHLYNLDAVNVKLLSFGSNNNEEQFL